MNKEDKLIRKRWRLITFLHAVVCPFAGLLFCFYIGLLVDNWSFFKEALPITIMYLLLLSVLYYCAYTEHGNKYLKWCLVLGGFRAIFYFMLDVSPWKLDTAWGKFFYFTNFGVYVLWFYFGWRLVGVNNRIKEKMNLKLEAK